MRGYRCPAAHHGFFVAILFANASCYDGPNGFGLFIAFLIGLAATILLQVGVIAWGVEVGTSKLRAAFSELHEDLLVE